MDARFLLNEFPLCALLRNLANQCGNVKLLVASSKVKVDAPPDSAALLKELISALPPDAMRDYIQNSDSGSRLTTQSFQRLNGFVTSVNRGDRPQKTYTAKTPGSKFVCFRCDRSIENYFHHRQSCSAKDADVSCDTCDDGLGTHITKHCVA